MEAIYVDVRSPGSFGGIMHTQFETLQRSFGAGGEEVSGRTGHVYATQTEKNSLSPPQDILQRHLLYQIDLADVSNLAAFNDGARYLLPCIDVFSKRAWAVPIRTKTGRDVANAFEKILINGTPNMVHSDKGTEFLNSTFQSMLKRKVIKFYTSENEDLKASVVERFNRTLKTKMYRYFCSVLPLDDQADFWFMGSTGMTPAEVDVDNEHMVRKHLYPIKPKSHKWKYEVGDRVRIAMQKRS